MRKGCWIACAVICTALRLDGQPAAISRFDAAAVKKIGGACAGPPLRMTAGRIMLHCFSLRQLIGTAFNPLTDYDHDHTAVAGGPAWIDSARYDIEAKAGGATLTEMTGVMLLSLLRERFRLETHRESRDTPVYLLTIADRGPRLKPADSKACDVRDLSTFQSGGSLKECGRSNLHGRGDMRMIDAYSVSLDAFGAALSTVAGRRIVNRAGLTGKYDIHLEFAKDSLSSGPVVLNGEPGASGTPDPSGGVSLFTAIQKQLGLKLTAATLPIDVIVVDHVDEPSGN